jgi:ubiquinone/menaquinone biosynthesis C-methylase UbiE
MSINQFIDPEEVLDEFILRSDMIAAEFGCGSGGFAIPLAKRLEDGLVYGIDIQQEPLSALKSHCLIESIVNVKIILSNLEKERGSTLYEGSVDLVFIPNVLFQIENKNAIIAEAKRILKINGRLIIIDWLPNANQGPEQGRISPNEVKDLAKNNSFKLEKEFKAGKYHYVLAFEKI